MKKKGEKGGTDGLELPMGLGMALSQRPDAMARFAGLPEEEKRRIIDHTHEIRSRQEMQSYVSSLFNAPAP